jgi:hypothetical protein
METVLTEPPESEPLLAALPWYGMRTLQFLAIRRYVRR